MMQLFPLSSMYCSTIAHARRKCGVLATWQAGLEAGRGRGRETMDCRGILGDSKWRLVIIMQTFTLGTAIGLNMNASFLCWQRKRCPVEQSETVFWVGCVFAGNVFTQIHEINPTGKFPNRPWNYGKRVRFTNKASIGNIGAFSFDWDRKGAIYGEKGQL